MKTSNKILVLFFILLLLLPVVIFSALRKKIINKEFKVVDSVDIPDKLVKKQSLQPAKYIRVIGTGNKDESFVCMIVPAATASYEYRLDEIMEDSISIQQAGDTLLVQYTSQPNKKNARPPAVLYLYQPVINGLFAEGVTIGIDSVHPANPPVTIELSKGASIGLGENKLGDYNRERGIRVNSGNLQLQKLQIRAIDGSISIGKKVSFNELELTLLGQSTLSIPAEATINTVKGTISENSVINGNWKYIRQLTNSNEQ